jgi:CRP/FNR family transcriptional regulator
MPTALQPSRSATALERPGTTSLQDITAVVVDRIGSSCQASARCSAPDDSGRASRRRVHCAGRKLHTGQALFEQGARAGALYAVRSGTLKSSLILADGRELVCDFHLPGQLMAFDSIAGGAHPTTATALEDTHVCAIPHAQLDELIRQDPALRAGLNRMMSQEIARGQRIRTLLGLFCAQERLAVFLLDLSGRYRALGQSPHDFNLRMTRADIGSYLGLQLETVSRTFSAFQQQGLVRIDYRRVRILDLPDFARRYAGLLQA